MGEIGGALAIIAFWIFLAIVSVAGIRYDYLKKHLAVETLRQAIQSGHSVDPALLERLLSHQKHTEGQEQVLDPRLLKIGGIITIASGVGLAALAAFVARVLPGALYPIMGAGALAICVGIGLLISARVMARGPAPEHPGDHGA
jgi:hypothetical protein